jgi:hypothetical protein
LRPEQARCLHQNISIRAKIRLTAKQGFRA